MTAVTRRSGRFPWGLLLLPSLLGSGCTHYMGSGVPTELTQSRQLVDVNAPPGSHKPVDQHIAAELLTRFQQSATQGTPNPPTRQYQILALSGGGAYGAYSVGVLAGWTCSGRRPTFDIVTGVSTGGIISTFAFLGPAYDARLVDMYTNTSSDDIYRMRPRASVLWSDSAATTEPLQHMIARHIDCQTLQAVAQAHQQGRRLYVGTTNLDTRRLVVWDLGAIASSGRPDALDLYRKVVLASASVPGFFPPVPIEVEINGQRYTELHADGGATSQVFLGGAMLPLDQSALQPGRLPLVGSNVYVIIAGKAYADPECIQPRITSIATSALASLTAAETRNDMARIWTLCMLTGMRYHQTAIPQSFPAPKEGLTFDPTTMRQMYNEGHRLAQSGQAWRNTPPGIDASEQVIPRAGTQFVGPVHGGAGAVP